MISNLGKLIILIGAALGSVTVAVLIGYIIQSMSNENKFIVHRSNRDRRAGINMAPPWESDIGLVFVERRVTPDRRARAR